MKNTNTITLNKESETIEIAIEPANKKGLSYRYRIVDNKNTNRIYIIDDSTKIYRLLERLYNHNFKEA